MLRNIAILLLAFLLVSCAGKPKFDVRTQTVAFKDLSTIEAPKDGPIIIAVYDFLDMTGQKKPGGNFASMSTAVTQGSYQLLIKALQDAGNGKWFRVVERASLPSLLQERKLIRSTRQQVNGEGAEPLPPLLFAGAYVTGGIVGYDSDTKSGGVGARILGIQNNKQFRQDIVTIILRLVNVQTGEVVIVTTVEKTIFSTSIGGDIFKYFDADTMLLEVEAGYAKNEPVTFAVRKAIEKGVVDLINAGADKGLWEFDVLPEIVVVPMKDLKVVTDDIKVKAEDVPITVHIGDEKIEKTYEDYLLQKELLKEERKKKLQEELNKEKEEEKAWEEVDENDDDSVDSNSINE
jgi:curli production assembly/transport component CsgG